jgi:hypothetical protein
MPVPKINIESLRKKLGKLSEKLKRRFASIDVNKLRIQFGTLLGKLKQKFTKTIETTNNIDEVKKIINAVEEFIKSKKFLSEYIPNSIDKQPSYPEILGLIDAVEKQSNKPLTEAIDVVDKQPNYPEIPVKLDAVEKQSNNPEILGVIDAVEKQSNYPEIPEELDTDKTSISEITDVINSVEKPSVPIIQDLEYALKNDIIKIINAVKTYETQLLKEKTQPVDSSKINEIVDTVEDFLNKKPVKPINLEITKIIDALEGFLNKNPPKPLPVVGPPQKPPKPLPVVGPPQKPPKPVPVVGPPTAIATLAAKSPAIARKFGNAKPLLSMFSTTSTSENQTINQLRTRVSELEKKLKDSDAGRTITNAATGLFNSGSALTNQAFSVKPKSNMVILDDELDQPIKTVGTHIYKDNGTQIMYDTEKNKIYKGDTIMQPVSKSKEMSENTSKSTKPVSKPKDGPSKNTRSQTGNTTTTTNNKTKPVDENVLVVKPTENKDNYIGKFKTFEDDEFRKIEEMVKNSPILTK